MTKAKIWLSPPHMSGLELKYVQEAFATNWIAPLGPNVDAFEARLSNYAGVKSSAALSSGSAALHLALALLGVGSGDIVLCQSFTFAASAFPILYLGATPVFIDSESETWNLSPESLELAIISLRKEGKQPKAVVGVHLYGMPAKMHEILMVCDRYEIPFIEDAAEALGSVYDGKMAGSLGKLSVFSFNGNKIITTSGGGALLSNDDELIKKAKFLAMQARDDAPHYQHSQVGYNYRLSNVSAGIGLGQMDVLSERIASRRKNFDYYHKALSGLPGIVFQPEVPGSVSNRWLTCLTIDAALFGASREDIRHSLAADNIEARPLWKPMHMQPVFKDAPYFGEKIAENLFANGLCLPSGSSLSEAELDLVISHFLRGNRNR